MPKVTYHIDCTLCGSPSTTTMEAKALGRIPFVCKPCRSRVPFLDVALLRAESNL